MCVHAVTVHLQAHSLTIEHIETRQHRHPSPSTDTGTPFNVLFRLTTCRRTFVDALTELIGDTRLLGVVLYVDNAIGMVCTVHNVQLVIDPSSVPWYPRCMRDLDKCSAVATKYEPDMDPRHPVSDAPVMFSIERVQGFGDVDYIARRAKLNDLALKYR